MRSTRREPVLATPGRSMGPACIGHEPKRTQSAAAPAHLKSGNVGVTAGLRRRKRVLFCVRRLPPRTGRTRGHAMSQISLENYIDARVDDQINWYSNASGRAQKGWKALRLTEVVVAAAHSLRCRLCRAVRASLRSRWVCWAWSWRSITGVLGVYKLQENWLLYRGTAEALKREKFLMMTRRGAIRRRRTPRRSSSRASRRSWARKAKPGSRLLPSRSRRRPRRGPVGGGPGIAGLVDSEPWGQRADSGESARSPADRCRRTSVRRRQPLQRLAHCFTDFR